MLEVVYAPIFVVTAMTALIAGTGVPTLLAFLLLVFWRMPPWLVVILGAAATAAVAAVAG